MYRKWKRLLVLLLSITMLAAFSPSSFSGNTTPDTVLAKSPSTLSVHFIDVGQGDAELITCDGHAMLIDAGGNDKGTTVQLYLKKQGVKSLDYIIGTHPDEDHIGGLDVIITKFTCNNIFLSGFTKDTKTYDDVLSAIQYKNEKSIVPKDNALYKLGSASFRIIGPDRTYETANDNSIVILLTYGKNKFLFAGDAEEAEENGILSTQKDLKADVYKVAHHGSRTASTSEFMKAVDPAYAVISCGENNDYGHPHAEVLNRFRSMGIKVYRTDEQGSIIATSDGSSITWNCAPSETWQAGEATGSSAGSSASSKTAAQSSTKTSEISYVLNTNTKKFHRASCRSVAKMSEKNKKTSTQSRDEIIAEGYTPCKICNP